MRSTVSMRFVGSLGEVSKASLKGANIDMEIDCHVKYTPEEARANQDLINERMDKLVSNTTKHMQAIDNACAYVDPICEKIQIALRNAREREENNRSIFVKLARKLRKEEEQED